MDVNNTRFHLLLGPDDWADCDLEDVVWNGTRFDLTLHPEEFTFEPGKLDAPPQLSDRRGAGRDVFGNWYTIGPDARSILVMSVGDGSITPFWPVDAGCEPALPRPGTFGPSAPSPVRRAQRLQGAAVTTDHYLVVGTLDPPGLLVFDLESGDGPTELPWPDASFSPFDIAARPDGGVFVLDRDHKCVWELDRHFHVEPAAAASPPPEPFSFLPVAGPAPPPPPALSPAAATPVPGDPIAVEAAPGDGFLILDWAQVAHYAHGAPVGNAATLAAPGFDLALVGTTLYVVDTAGNQSRAFKLTLTAAGPVLEPDLRFYPMRRFGGKGLVAAVDNAYYDFGDRWIPLVKQPRSRYAEHGTLVTPEFDGVEPGCVWHRLVVDAVLPSGASLAVWSKASDELEGFAIAPWRREPDPRIRSEGAEVPFVDLGPYASHELLFQAAKGRYLQVKLDLIGDGRATPRLRALRAWFPRFSYLDRYLPGVYREDDASASFLDRYLANIEGISTAIEDRIAAAHVFFSPQTVPSDALEWLANWLALAFDPLWDDRRRRLFLANAMTFFQTRGTMRGIEILLRFALDRCLDARVFTDAKPAALTSARIVETYRTRRTPGVVFGDPTDLGPGLGTVMSGRWSPPSGGAALDAAYGTRYPIVDPGKPDSDAWRTFSRAALGFVPVPADASRWQAFLAHRYPNPAAVLTAYGSTESPPGDFSGFQPPAGPWLPPDGAALVDWFQFESVVVPMLAKAHRFSVLLPWPLKVVDSSGVQLTHERIRDLARRIVDVQRPAQTIFDVKFFWSAFRIGEARLGDDTLLASGSRVPELIEPAVLGRDYVGTSTLAGPVASDEIVRRPPSTPPEEAQ